MSLRKFFVPTGLIFLFLGQISSAMSVSSSECAVVGCGVLGTRVCKQIVASPEFSSWKGRMLGFCSIILFYSCETYS
jgi:hypothetical protein